MTTSEFLSQLEAVKDKEQSLIFDYGSKRVNPGYHVTEIKSTQVQSMDCGGQGNSWNETTIQLWSPENSNENHMSIAKFLSIYHQVSSSIAINNTATVRFEYGEIG